eukprot:8731287-Alexandrium_andersonii.AAC.1
MKIRSLALAENLPFLRWSVSEGTKDILHPKSSAGPDHFSPRRRSNADSPSAPLRKWRGKATAQAA